MSKERQETVADVVAEMRQDIANGTVGIWSDFGGEIARSIADRIEAAHKREREAGADAAQICGEIGEMVGREAACRQPVTDCHGLNAAAMREALNMLLGLFDSGLVEYSDSCDTSEYSTAIAKEASSTARAVRT